MIVDDDKEFLEEFKETLVLSGYEVIAVNSASSVVDIAQKTKPQLILLDLKMPSKSGLQIAYELKHLPEFESVPIIAMTAFLKDGHLPFMNICGIQRCIKKPFNPLDIIAQIEAVSEK